MHESVALAGIGFDKTVSKVIADPETDKMTHHISVKGISWKFIIESFAQGEVTGSYTPESVYQTIKRVCGGEPGIRLA